MIPVRSDLFANLDEDSDTQTPIAEGLRDDEEFLSMMNARGPHNTTQAAIETSPPRNINEAVQSTRIANVPDSVVNDPPVTNAAIGRKRKRNGNSGPTKKRKRTRGRNRAKFAQQHPEKLQFNSLGQPVAPAKKVAQFSRFIGQLAADCSNFPIDAKNWDVICKGDKLEDAWVTVKESLDWSDPDTLQLEDDIKEVIVEKIHDRWRSFRYKLKKNWYKPFIGTDFRFSCGNKHVHPDQWLALVAKWDGAQNREVAGTNTENRLQLKMPHTTGTKTFAQLRYEWELEHPGEVLDRVTFLTLVYTSKKKDPKNPQPINQEAQKKLDELRELEKVVRDEGREITTEIRNELFHKVMGPEKRNRVRGYGVGVNWSDIPGIVTEKTGITQKIQALKDVYEAQREEYEKREAEMAKQLKEAAEREEALQANYVALNSKMDAIQGQVGANSLVQILAAAGIDSVESLDFGRLLNLLKKPENSQYTSQTNVQLTSECEDAGNGHNSRLCST